MAAAGARCVGHVLSAIGADQETRGDQCLLHHAGAIPVQPLVVQDRACALMVALVQDSLDLSDRQLVVAGPRLLTAQCADAVQDRGPIFVLPLVGLDLVEVELRQLGELGRDLFDAARAIALSQPNVLRTTAREIPGPQFREEQGNLGWESSRAFGLAGGCGVLQ